jgi:hypothetical protein
MRLCQLMVLAIGALPMVTFVSVRVAKTQPANDDSYWGEHTLSGVFQIGHTPAIALLWPR